ncbi:hypothetical protein FOA52_013316 [Chlamydomonas sp. UWO 241]|nr:hypothetical protein FOA52_013316 [Chlamydomonas sp. UWO 241]
MANTMGSGIVMGGDASQAGSTCAASVVEESGPSAAGSASGAVHSYEVRLVLEYCDGGDLFEMIKLGIFMDNKGLNYAAILETAADISKGMLHLHVNNILHADLKASNVMLKSSAIDGRGMVGKVVDFGLAIQLDTASHQTHTSNMIQGTMTHMAPEIMLMGKQSKPGDVYAFGISMYELIMAERPYIGIANALLGHQVVHDRKRPSIPSVFPAEYRSLASRCWAHDPEARPTFEDIVAELTAMRSRIKGRSRPLVIPIPWKDSTLSCGPPASPLGDGSGAGRMQLPDGGDDDDYGASDSPIVISGPLSNKLLLARTAEGLDPIVEGDSDASDGEGSGH